MTFALLVKAFSEISPKYQRSHNKPPNKTPNKSAIYRAVDIIILKKENVKYQAQRAFLDRITYALEGSNNWLSDTKKRNLQVSLGFLVKTYIEKKDDFKKLDEDIQIDKVARELLAQVSDSGGLGIEEITSEISGALDELNGDT